jgi:hypothetical protein
MAVHVCPASRDALMLDSSLAMVWALLTEARAIRPDYLEEAN